MASEHQKNDEWILKLETMLEKGDAPRRKKITVNKLQKTVEKYNRIQSGDQERKRRAKYLILEASKRIIERSQVDQMRMLNDSEGSKSRLKGIAAIADQLGELLESVLIRIEEREYAGIILDDFMPSVEEAARYATMLDPQIAAQMLRILNSAEKLGLNYNTGLRDVFEEVIQLHIIPKQLDASTLLMKLAENRLKEGEYLTSYILSREAIKKTVEDICGAYPRDLIPDNQPSTDWRFEDYLGYLIEAGLVSEEQGKTFLEVFVGEAEHLNSRWKKRRDAERALNEVKAYLEMMDADDGKDKWL